MYKNLRDFRESLNMTQKEFAASINLGLSTYNGYETGSREPKSDFWITIAKKYGVTIDYLMGFSNDPRKISDAPAPALSEDALQVARDYADLDRPGQRVVKVVIADQQARVREERKKARSKKHDGLLVEEDESPRVIPLYYTPAAAGYASPAFEEDFEYIDVGGDVPAWADFAVQIDGDSMEPYIMDGATVYVNRDPLRNGDVGIFYFAGDMLCKQYYRSPEGVVWLLSLNRERKEYDRRIPVDSGMPFVCYGRVILPKHPALAVPEDELK